MWAILNPKLARRHDALCRAAARLGDLREIALDAENAVPEGVPSAALRFCRMNAVERDIFTRPFEGDEAEESVKKYEHFLPRIAGVLDHLDGATPTPTPPPPPRKSPPATQNGTACSPASPR